MLFADLVAASGRVAATRGRLAKVAILAELLGRTGPDEVAAGIGFLVGWPRQGKLGVGWATMRQATEAAGVAATEATLGIAAVDGLFAQLATTSGKGSAAARRGILDELFSRATEPERTFLANLVMGAIRQGAVEGLVLEAVAKAGDVPARALQRATMLAGDLGAVAHALFRDGPDALARYRIEVLRPLLPMLAGSAPTAAGALTDLGTAAIEYKVDGARIQVHKSGNEVRVFTRSLNDVTEAVPEVVEAVRRLAPVSLILDGEVIALDGSGRPRPFQTTMRRFGRRLDVPGLADEIPLSAFFFDLLLENDQELLDRPQRERWQRLAAIAPAESLVPRLVTADPEAAELFFEQALAAGHEGIIAKSPDAGYEAGRRGSGWIKVKRAATLDLVVLAVEWGSGRREGWLSNLHLGARDPSDGSFVMLGKTFKGMTDELLQWQTEQLLAREVRREGHVVVVRPELVVEIAFDGVQASSQYPGGVALRFARVKGYRPDKSAAEADTIETVRGFLVEETGA